MNDAGDRLAELTRAQWRLALRLTATMMAVYFGFILMVAYAQAAAGPAAGARPVASGIAAGRAA